MGTMNFTVAQHIAIMAPVQSNDDMRPGHIHTFIDIHGRDVVATVTVSQYESILFGAPVWECRISLGRHNNIYRLSNKMVKDAYAAAVFALAGVGTDLEYVSTNDDKTAVSLRVPLTEDELDVLEANAGRPGFAIAINTNGSQDRPEEHRTRYNWMDKAQGSLFQLLEPAKEEDDKQS